jgi:hypothetical protein
MGDARIDNSWPLAQHDQCGEGTKEIASDWLPIEQAQFYFLSGWAGKGQSWRDAVARTIEGTWCRVSLDWEVLERMSEDKDEVRIRVGNVCLIIEVPTAEFSVMSTTNPADEMDWGETIVDNGRTPSGSPDQFLKQFSIARIKSKYEASAINALRLAESLIDRFAFGFESALRNGDAIIFARAGSPLAAFERIKFDQWRYFRRRGLGTAEGPHGEKLYSIHIKPKLTEKPLELVKGFEARLAETSPELVKQFEAPLAKTRLDTKGHCASWLRRLMEASPDRAIAPKDCLHAQALEQWPKLSRRAFDSAWDFAIQQTGASSWAKSGPRPKS